MCQVVDKAAEVAATAATSLVERGILGSLLVLSLVGIVLLVRELTRVQDQRVKDSFAFSDIMEKYRDKISGVLDQTHAAQANISSTLDRLSATQIDHTRVLQEVKGSLENVQRTLEGVIRDAVRRSRPDDFPAPSRTGARYEQDERGDR